MTTPTTYLSATSALPGEVATHLDGLAGDERERALRLLGVAERCCGGDVAVLVAIVEALTHA